LARTRLTVSLAGLKSNEEADRMQDVGTRYGARADARAASTTTLLGQVMFLVAVALAFTVAGTYIGRDLTDGTAFVLFLAGFGMLLVQGFVERLRVGTFAIAWLYAIALLIGLGLGPTISYLVANDPSTVTQAAGATALITLGMGAGGFALRPSGSRPASSSRSSTSSSRC
jgi:hypothetical protein